MVQKHPHILDLMQSLWKYPPPNYLDKSCQIKLIKLCKSLRLIYLKFQLLLSITYFGYNILFSCINYVGCTMLYILMHSKLNISIKQPTYILIIICVLNSTPLIYFGCYAKPFKEVQRCYVNDRWLSYLIFYEILIHIHLQYPWSACYYPRYPPCLSPPLPILYFWFHFYYILPCSPYTSRCAEIGHMFKRVLVTAYSVSVFLLSRYVL